MNEGYKSSGIGLRSGVEIDRGLRSYMLGVYNYMVIGLLFTGIMAYGFANIPSLLSLLYSAEGGILRPTGLNYFFMFAPLGFIFLLSFGVNRLSARSAGLAFFAFSGVMGVSLTNILLIYTSESVVRTFFICSATFAGMSLYGYTTRRDLTGMGSFLFMGLIGIIIASVVNMFLGSSMLQFAISVVGVLVFVGLTVYDTQRIKHSYSAYDSGELVSKKSVYGALSLYLNFINLFLMLLHLFGQRR